MCLKFPLWQWLAMAENDWQMIGIMNAQLVSEL